MSTENYVSLISTAEPSYRSISTADIHQQIPQREKIHSGAPSCHLIIDNIARGKNNRWMIIWSPYVFCGSDYCWLPLVSPARNCSAWRTRSDQHEAKENQGLWELAGHICHIWTFSSNCQSHNTCVVECAWQKMLLVWNKLQTTVPTINVLARPSVLKMLSNKLKKLVVISSTAPGLLWQSSTTLQQHWGVNGVTW